MATETEPPKRPFDGKAFFKERPVGIHALTVSEAREFMIKTLDAMNMQLPTWLEKPWIVVIS